MGVPHLNRRAGFFESDQAYNFKGNTGYKREKLESRYEKGSDIKKRLRITLHFVFFIAHILLIRVR